jgi:hypothetical protein
MNWGKKYPTTNINDVPERERHEVEVFDVRKFVDEKVKKNKDNLLDFGGPGVGGGLPFFNNMPSSNPFMSPFDMPSSKPKNTTAPMPKENDFDVDDIVKKIDAKIAQLEKEEEEAKKKEAAAGKKDTDINMSTVISSPKAQAENNDNLDKLINSNKPVVDVKPIEDKPIDNKPTTTKTEKDDDFFDDFFDE